MRQGQTGISQADCTVMCIHQVYAYHQCIEGSCIPSDKGVSLATCQAGCGSFEDQFLDQLMMA